MTLIPKDHPVFPTGLRRSGLAQLLNKKRALFVLTKIDEILAWERKREAEQDTRFVELGRYLCEVRAAWGGIVPACSLKNTGSEVA